MRVWVYHSRTWEEFGAVRWVAEWHVVRPEAKGKEEIEPDVDVVCRRKAYKSKREALKTARLMVNTRRTAFGCATVQEERVDWFVEEDRVAEWADVGDPEYVE